MERLPSSSLTDGGEKEGWKEGEAAAGGKEGTRLNEGEEKEGE